MPTALVFAIASGSNGKNERRNKKQGGSADLHLTHSDIHLGAQMQEVFDAVANGMRVMAKILNAAAISNDMKPGQVRDLAEK